MTRSSSVPGACFGAEALRAETRVWWAAPRPAHCCSAPGPSRQLQDSMGQRWTSCVDLFCFFRVLEAEPTLLYVPIFPPIQASSSKFISCVNRSSHENRSSNHQTSFKYSFPLRFYSISTCFTNIFPNFLYQNL